MRGRADHEPKDRAGLVAEIRLDHGDKSAQRERELKEREREREGAQREGSNTQRERRECSRVLKERALKGSTQRHAEIGRYKTNRERAPAPRRIERALKDAANERERELKDAERQRQRQSAQTHRGTTERGEVGDEQDRTREREKEERRLSGVVQLLLASSLLLYSTTVFLYCVS